MEEWRGEKPQAFKIIFVVQLSSPTVGDPMACSMPGSSVLYYLLEFAHVHVHWICDAI